MSPAALRMACLPVLLAVAAPAAAQIAPSTELDRTTLLKAPPIDLVVQDVAVTNSVSPAPATLAQVRIANLGSADATFPAGSIVARGDPLLAGGIAFQPMTTPVPFVVPAGGTKTLTLNVGDLCAAGNPGVVSMKVDPGNVVRETNETNNSLPVRVPAFSSGDLVALGVSLANSQAMGSSPAGNYVAGGYPYDEVVAFRNVGPGPVLWCPDVALWRETASPLAGKYGLRGIKNTSGHAIIYPPIPVGSSASTNLTIPGAYQPGDLPPGPYTITVVINPDGRIREASTANNTVTGQFGIR